MLKTLEGLGWSLKKQSKCSVSCASIRPGLLRQLMEPTSTDETTNDNEWKFSVIKNDKFWQQKVKNDDKVMNELQQNEDEDPDEDHSKKCWWRKIIPKRTGNWVIP